MFRFVSASSILIYEDDGVNNYAPDAPREHLDAQSAMRAHPDAQSEHQDAQSEHQDAP